MSTSATATSSVHSSPSKAAQLLDLIETISCALWEIETDETGRAKRFIFLSTTAEKLFGHPYEFLLDPPNWAKIVHPDDLDMFVRLSNAPFPADDRKTYRHRIVAADGRVIPIEATVTLVRNESGDPVALHGVTLDISEQYRSIERWKTLAHTSNALGQLKNIETTLQAITQLLVPTTADICSIHLKIDSVGPPTPAIIASTPELEAMLRESTERFPPRAETRAMILNVLESKQSFVIDVTDEFRRANSTSEEHYEFQKRMDIRSAIITPLFVEEELLGVIMISIVGSKPSFTEVDRFFLEELARQASVAIYNVRLLNASRELAKQAREEAQERHYTQDWVELASHVSITLASAADVEAALQTLANEFVPRIADFCAILLSDSQNPDDLRTIAYVSDPPESAGLALDIFSRLSASENSPFYLRRILADRTPQVHLTHDERLYDSFISSAIDHPKSLKFTSSVLLPLVAYDKIYGVMFFARSENSGRTFGDRDIPFIEEIARRAALSLYKASLFKEAQNELERRTRLQLRLELLEEISQRVAGSLNVQELLHAVSSIVAPRFADWLTVDLVTSNGALDRVFLYHSDPVLRPIAENYRLLYRHDIPSAQMEMLRTGNPLLIQLVTEERNKQFGLSHVRLEMLRELGAHSLIMVPLRSRRRTLGIIGFDYGHSGREFHSEDVEFAIEIASRLAAGIDNALLFEEAGQEIARRAELQKHLEEAKEEAEVANRAKDQFIATLSHELRTPLTPVLATIDLLGGDKEFPESLQPYLNVLRRNVQIETRLIDDLLDMTRITKGKLRFIETDVDLHVLIAEVTEICQQEFDRGSLRLVTRFHAEHPFVRGDRDRLRQVLWNVLHNATKFTPEGGLIAIRTKNEDMDHITVEIEDTGCGIEQSELVKIFEPFEQRSELRDGTYGGLGLGLAISRSIVELHGGAIEAKSPGAGHGTTFILKFNISRVIEQSNRAPAGIAFVTTRSGRILMVDDHVDTNAAIKILLERRGYHVTTAASVARGLELARLHPFDVLISDIGLPDGDGVDLLRAIRSDGRTSPTMRAIAVSGYGTQADIERSIAAGFKYHLKKPIAFPDLERVIVEVMEDPV